MISMFKKSSGVYVITNTENGKCYVGSAINFSKRWAVHRHQLKKNKHGNKHLQASWNKYGAHCFLFEVALLCACKDLLFYEQLLIDVFIPEYNKRATASSNLGLRPTLESRKKMSEFQKTRRHSEETKAKLSSLKTGLKHTPESKEKMRRAHLGKPSPRKGMTLSPETIAKMSAALKGRKSPRARPVEIDGVIYESAAQAEREIGVRTGTLTSMLCGYIRNKLNVRYAQCST